MGISSDRWAIYMRDRLGLENLTPAEIRDEVVGRMVAFYTADVPLLPGARDAVETTRSRWPLGIASGSDRVLLDTVLAAAGLADAFSATVSGDEVAVGKPAPLIYEEVCRRLGSDPLTCMAIEDSGAGIESALAAGMSVLAVPRPGFEPGAAVLARATAVVPDLTRLTPALVSDVLARV
jgi:HAD superfamily hydrolase (TIGR01509 family)